MTVMLASLSRVIATGIQNYFLLCVGMVACLHLFSWERREIEYSALSLSPESFNSYINMITVAHLTLRRTGQAFYAFTA